MWRALAALLALACTEPKPDVDPPPTLEGPEPPAPALSARSCETSELLCDGGTTTEAVPSCCDARWVPGGAFKPGFSLDEVQMPEDLAPEDRERDASVGGFFLDRFEVTRGRFLRFAAAYAPPLSEGAGAHPRIEGSGWNTEWNRYLPSDAGELVELTSCGAPSDPISPPLPSLDTGIDSLQQDGAAPSMVAADPASEDLPMGCLSWFVAFAFCAWDGGRLPTETEWEYAAAAGRQNRSFPWGNDGLLTSASLGRGQDPVGSRPETAGRYGQEDLAGSVEEWVLDWFHYERLGCDDCAELEPSFGRSIRGGADHHCCPGLDTQFRAAARNDAAPGLARPEYGVRCARDPVP